MNVDIEKVFEIAAPAEAAWGFLQNIPGVAGCMPGAEITETIDDTHYKGKVKAKVGPAMMAFDGDIEVTGLDQEKYELKFVAKGQDTKGTSSAAMDLTATVLNVEGGHCQLHGVATVTVNGKAASLGGRMMTQVADQILNQFGVNFVNNVISAAGSATEAEQARAELKEQPKELNGLSFAWSIFIGFIKSLFGNK